MTDLMGLDGREMAELIGKMGQPAYRARQLMGWIYQKGRSDFDDMTDLPLSFRRELREGGCEIRTPEEVQRAESADGAVKFLLRLHDGECVESVYIPEGPRHTVCVSTQVGCGMGCAFCATAGLGLTRNLSAGEIVGQVLKVQRLLKTRITNTVAMGQGEPLANYDALVKAFTLLGSQGGVGIAARHLAVSTCGLPEGIARLAREGRQWRLSVSLHAARDGVRDTIMPVNKRHPLEQLRRACLEYCALTGRRITFACVLIAGRNDGREDAQAIVRFCQGMLAHVNLIPWNPVPGVDLAPPGEERIELFRRWVAAGGISVTKRKSRGTHQSAACGQLHGGRRGDEE